MFVKILLSYHKKGPINDNFCCFYCIDVPTQIFFFLVGLINSKDVYNFSVSY